MCIQIVWIIDIMLKSHAWYSPKSAYEKRAFKADGKWLNKNKKDENLPHNHTDKSITKPGEYKHWNQSLNTIINS